MAGESTTGALLVYWPKEAAYSVVKVGTIRFKMPSTEGSEPKEVDPQQLTAIEDNGLVGLAKWEGRTKRWYDARILRYSEDIKHLESLRVLENGEILFQDQNLHPNTKLAKQRLFRDKERAQEVRKENADKRAALKESDAEAMKSLDGARAEQCNGQCTYCCHRPPPPPPPSCADCSKRSSLPPVPIELLGSLRDLLAWMESNAHAGAGIQNYEDTESWMRPGSNKIKLHKNYSVYIPRETVNNCVLNADVCGIKNAPGVLCKTLLKEALGEDEFTATPAKRMPRSLFSAVVSFVNNKYGREDTSRNYYKVVNNHRQYLYSTTIASDKDGAESGGGASSTKKGRKDKKGNSKSTPDTTPDTTPKTTPQEETQTQTAAALTTSHTEAVTTLHTTPMTGSHETPTHMTDNNFSTDISPNNAQDTSTPRTPVSRPHTRGFRRTADSVLDISQKIVKTPRYDNFNDSIPHQYSSHQASYHNYQNSPYSWCGPHHPPPPHYPPQPLPQNLSNHPPHHATHHSPQNTPQNTPHHATHHSPQHTPQNTPHHATHHSPQNPPPDSWNLVTTV